MDFKLGISGDSGDESVDEILEKDLDEDLSWGDVLEHKVNRLESRLTLQSILVLLLFLALGVFFYLDFTNRIAKVRDTGASKVEIVARELGADMDAVAADLTQRMEKISKDLSQVQNAQMSTWELAEEVKKGLNADTAALEKEMDARTRELSERFSSLSTAMTQSVRTLRDDFSDLSARSARLHESLSDVRKRLKKMDGKVASLKESLNALARAKADKTLLDKLLAHQQTLLESQINELEKQFEEMASLLKDLQALWDEKPGAEQSPAAGKAIVEQDL
ncbi:MAG: hypothetical protein JRI97_11655 [Deltaproteobacteria bacterium]|nr:hypothetical protein [Deltaproteobacteria bacterium]